MVASANERDKTIANAPLVATLEGLLLQGALLSSEGSLTEPNPDGQEYVASQDIRIAYIPKREAERFLVNHSSRTLKIPVYMTSSREQILFECDLPITQQESTWIQGGVAFFLSA